MTEIERLVEWLAETAFNAGYADCASTYDIPQRVTVIEADAANDAAKAALLAALKGAEGERDEAIKLLDGWKTTHAQWMNATLRAEARAAAAEAERDAAVAALRPFAKAGELFPPRFSEDYDQCIYSPAAGPEYSISGDDLRRARAALASNSGGGDAQSQEQTND